MEQGSWRASVHYQGVADEDVVFDVGSAGTCNTTAAGVNFPCGSTGEIKAEGSADAVLGKIIFQPYERMQYYLSAGAGNYRLDVSTIRLRGDRPGFLYAAGFKALAMSESPMTPAIAIDAGVSLERYFFNRAIGSAASNIDERLELLRTQVAIEASKRFMADEKVPLEPYGGLKWQRTQAWIKDLASGDRQGGQHNAVMPFIGLNVPIFDSEGFFAEATFANGVRYAAGLTLGFGGNGKKA
jgi:hypothetical protein